MTTGPAALLWDMDGTLVDSEKIWTVSLQQTAHAFGGELSPAARSAVVGSDMARTLVVFFEELGLPPEPERMAEVERYLSRRTSELFGAGLEWRPGAREALRTVQAAGWPMALVTNTGRALTEVALDVIGRSYFAVTVCGDEVPAGKPDPDPYLRAAQLLGLSAGDCLAVEDSPTGALAAERAGAGVLVVPCEEPVPDSPHRVLRESLSGLTAEDIRHVYARTSAARAA